MWQLCGKMARPEQKAVGPQIVASRGMGRLLSHAGLAADRLPAFGAKGLVQNKDSVEINGREGGNGGI